jgi:hypothetical protein
MEVGPLLHGRLEPRGADWLELNGTIESDVTANLRASGITGSPKHTPFHPYDLPFR